MLTLVLALSAMAHAQSNGSSPNLTEARRFSLRFQGQLRTADRPASLILLVEDNPGDVDLLREALEANQVTCDLLVLTDGEQAFKWLNAIEAGQRPCPDLFINSSELAPGGLSGALAAG